MEQTAAEGQYPIKTWDIGKNVCQAVVPLKYPASVSS